MAKSTIPGFWSALLLLAASSRPTQAALTTEYLAANDLNFTCTVLQHMSEDADAPVKQVMLLHGFPMFRVWWLPLLEQWNTMLTADSETAPMSVHAVACDLRGYSPGASPDDIADYDYSIFAEDTFALAEAAGFESFHLVGHDHGAGLAWYVAGNDPDSQVLSLTTMSVPHLDLMSDALCGDNTDEAQVVASNYFNQFSLPDSATANNASLTAMFAISGLPVEPVSFQKMLWWYNGSLAKHFAMPRVVSDEEVMVFAEESVPGAAQFVQGTRAAIPMEERPCILVENDPVGAITVPTLFICGLQDTALLCNNSFATDVSSDLLPNYEHVNYQCGHDFFLEGQCDSMEESQAVMDKITAFVLGDMVPIEDDGMGMDTNTTATTGADADADADMSATTDTVTPGTDTTDSPVASPTASGAAIFATKNANMAWVVGFVMVSGLVW